MHRVDEAAGGYLPTLDRGARAALPKVLRGAEPGASAMVEAAIVKADYRDDCVLNAIGIEARPPFPKDYALCPTDWSLVDPVRTRGPIWHRCWF